MFALTLPSPPEEGLRSNAEGWIALSAMTPPFCPKRWTPSPRGKVPAGRMRGNSGYRIIECPNYYAR